MKILYLITLGCLAIVEGDSDTSINNDTSLLALREAQLLVTRNKRSLNYKSINDDPNCLEMKLICNEFHEDLLILECLFGLDNTIIDNLKKDCQHVIWLHTTALIENSNVQHMLQSSCESDFPRLSCRVDDKPNNYLKCLVNNKDTINEPSCTSMVERLESVAFYDLAWIANFLEHCKGDVEKFFCGRLDSNSLSQSTTIACLQTKTMDLTKECRREVFKLSEIQADNIKLDRLLYTECASDHARYCRQFKPGSGRVFKCLMQHRTEKLTSQCQNQLLRRQKLITQDYKINRGMMRACKEDIKKSHCRRQTSDDKAIRVAQILVCLEAINKNGTKLSPDCESEMNDQRRVLMEDYRLTPEIVDGCSKDIENFCVGLEIGGKTIHCLMEHAKMKNQKTKRITDPCQRALEVLVKQVDLGEDWRVDPVLHEHCYAVVKTSCADVRGGNARVLSCLMDNLGADHMPEDCEDALVQIQYFVARDFKLDPQLYKSCKEDAKRFCHADTDWVEGEQNYDPNNAPLVLPCLYRYAYPQDQTMQLKRACLDQIHRVMKQRAISVDLQPEIEQVCLSDLALYCYERTQKDEEMLCLQDHLENLMDKCKDAVSKVTEIEAEKVDLNPMIMKHCKRVMQTHCEPELKNDKDEGDVMECLIAHKNELDVKADNKCRINIEHFQLISLKNYHFSYKFKIACKTHAMRFCREAKTKSAIVGCLSEKVRNDTVSGIRNSIPKECRQQLKAQLFQQRENVDFDADLKKACKDDIMQYCSDVESGSGQTLECLQSTPKKLTDSCQEVVFKIKRQEMNDNSIDYALVTTCGDMVQRYCPLAEHAHILDCLKTYKNELAFNSKCRQIIIHRMTQQFKDYRLNPMLQTSCNMDINKFCKDTIKQHTPKGEFNGVVIKCLKQKFRESKLSSKCEAQMADILREQALAIQLNPLLRAVCKPELETICKPEEDDNESSGKTEECLKDALLNKKIQTPECQVEVAGMIEESQADIHVDPLLQRACANDLLKFCNDVQQGGGRHIKCLKIILSDKPNQLQPECRNMFTKRLEMFKNAEQVSPPENFNELYSQVVSSPAKRYFIMILFTIIGFIFIMGLFCGRISRRQLMTKMK